MLSGNGKTFHRVDALVSCYPGTFEIGPLEQQMELTLNNLRQSLERAGGSLAHVIQVVVYFVDPIGRALLNEVWARYFPPPTPNRAIVGVRELAIPGVGFHLAATAWLEG